MRMWQYSETTGGLVKNLKLSTDASVPTVKPGEVLIEVACASINPVDYKIVEIPYIGKYLTTRPAAPASDFAGTVFISGGGSSHGFSHGDRVCGTLARPGLQYGTLSQFVSVPTALVSRLPDNVSFEQGSTLGIAGITAYQTLAPFVKAGDKVLINGGSGGVGSFTVQIAKILGCHVTASCSGKSADFVKSLGADEIIDYTKGNLTQQIRQKQITFDHVVDNVGNSNDLHAACDYCLKPGGIDVQVGGSLTLWGILATLRSALLPVVLGGFKSKWKFLGANIADSKKDVAQLIEWTAEGRLKPQIEQEFSYEEAPKAYAKLKEGHPRGKIIISTRKG